MEKDYFLNLRGKGNANSQHQSFDQCNQAEQNLYQVACFLVQLETLLCWGQCGAGVQFYCPLGNTKLLKCRIWDHNLVLQPGRSTGFEH